MHRESVEERQAASSGLSRRRVVAGAAWSVPVVALATAAPSFAVSPSDPIPANALNGWVRVTRDCNAAQISISSAGAYPNGGLWVFSNQQQPPSNAQLVFYFPTSWGILTWTSGNRAWSAPVYEGQVTISGQTYNAYRSTYNGQFQWATNGGVYTGGGGPAGPERWEAVTAPSFTTSRIAWRSCGNGDAVYLRRTVTVNGKEITFRRTLVF